MHVRMFVLAEQKEDTSYAADACGPNGPLPTKHPSDDVSINCFDAPNLAVIPFKHQLGWNEKSAKAHLAHIICVKPNRVLKKWDADLTSYYPVMTNDTEICFSNNLQSSKAS